MHGEAFPKRKTIKPKYEKAVEYIFTATIAVFQLVGYFVWNEEVAGSSPACYTYGPFF